MNRFLGRAACAAAAIVLTVTAAPAPGWAVDPSKGTPGFCTSNVGVTVVVDFQQLGGTTIVRCFPSAKRGTGLDALAGAGFQIQGVLRWGDAFVCRIENRPSAVESIPVSGDEGYKERCIDTPPAKSYWSYWHAGNDCDWHYSQWGVKNRDFVPGGFEGWSFSLNASADSNPRPRIAPVRPGTGGQPCVEPDEPAPINNDPNQHQPGNTGSDPGPQPTGTSTGGGGSGGDGGGRVPTAAPTSTALPAPLPRERASTAAPDPSHNVAFTGGQNAANVNDEIRRQAEASRYAPWAAAGTVALLGAAMWWTRRRRRARNT